MNVEELSLSNVRYLTELVLELWPDCEFEEEYEEYRKRIGLENEICYLIKEQEHYIAFIHLTIRNDYVEGAENLPIAYLEGIYVRPDFRKKGVAKKLIVVAEEWVKQKGLGQIASDAPITNLSSIEFHTKTGFSEVERIVCFVKNL